MTEKGTIPPIKPIKTCTVNDLMEVIHSEQNMLSILMKKEISKDDIRVLEVVVRKFLIVYSAMDETIRLKNTPSWISHYNFTSLFKYTRLNEGIRVTMTLVGRSNGR